MWKCSRCGEEHDEQFESCWKCQEFRQGAILPDGDPDDGGASLGRSETEAPQQSGSKSASTRRTSGSNVGRAIINRYKDGYKVAEAINFVGQAVKVVGLILFIILAALSLSAGDQGSWGIAAPASGFGVVISALVGGLIYVVGILVAAQGQLLMASLDNAVNTSPFLTDRERAEAMKISLQA